jgi:negative regulator of flagellin synthesis FlgM
MRVSQSTSNPVQGSEVSSAKSTEKAEGAHQRKTAKAAATEGKANIEGSTNTELSSKGREMAQAKAIAEGAPDVREEKIAELKRRIAGGKYSMDHEAIADKMVDEHLKMSGIG